MGNDKRCTIKGIGSMKLRLFDGTERILTLVRYIHELKRNLISLGTLDKAGYTYKVENRVMKIYKGSLLKLKGVLENGLYVLQGSTSANYSHSVTDPNSKLSVLWHRRLGHISQKGLMELQKQGLLGKDKVVDIPFCDHCVLGKAAKVRFNRAEHHTGGILDYIHSDLWVLGFMP